MEKLMMFSDESIRRDSHRSVADPQTAKFPVPMDICLSLVTVPLLAGLVIGTSVLTLIKQGGEMSEETLRGDRLPILNLPLQ
jgi:hypothetical protein